MATSTLGKSAAANAPMTGEERRSSSLPRWAPCSSGTTSILYGSLAAIIAKQFFGLDAGSAFIFALLAFAAGFIVRPFGALVFGRLGDMIGRKYTFLVTILIMGLSTFIVGILPTYASIGVAAPVILIALRLLRASRSAASTAARRPTSPSTRRTASAVPTPRGSRPPRRWACSCR